jgi:hypothetical protein
MKLVTLLILLLGLTSCKSDRIDHTDSNYIYVWKYNISGDSTLYKYQQPRIIERKVMGGRMKNKKIKVDLNNDGNYYKIRVPYGMNRSNIVRQAQRAAGDRKPLIGVFREEFYPYHKIEFIKYK